jgi:hypothetical protein
LDQRRSAAERLLRRPGVLEAAARLGWEPTPAAIGLGHLAHRPTFTEAVGELKVAFSAAGPRPGESRSYAVVGELAVPIPSTDDWTLPLPVNRREFLMVLAGGVAAPQVALEAARHALATGLERAGGSGPDDWLAIAAEYTRDYYTNPPADLLRQLTIDLLVLPHVIEQEPNQSRVAQLHAVAAQLAVVGAKSLTDLGRIREARRWWSTARTAADLSANMEIQVWTRDWEAVNGLHTRRPVTAMLSLADQALGIAGGLPCSGTAGVLAARAQALALMGRHAEAAATLHRLADVSAELPSGVQADDISLFGWPECRLRHTESYVHTYLGNTRLAYAAQDRALRLYPQELAKERAEMEVQRARCLVIDGHVTEGVAYANGVLDGLASIHHELIELGQDLVAAVPLSERSRPAIAEFRERLVPPGKPGPHAG